jgi:transposase
MARTRTIVAGVDTHADTHYGAVLDQRGRLLDTAQFPATGAGHRQMLTWIRGLGHLSRVGVEGTGSYGAGLTRYLNAEGVEVIEVNRTNPGTRRRRGKSDPIDAEAAARAVLSGEATATPKDRTGIVEAIRVLRVTRTGAVKTRTAALNQLKDLITTAPEELRTQLRGQPLSQAAKTCTRLRPDTTRLNDPVQATKTALQTIGTRVGALTDEITTADKRLKALLIQAAPRTMGMLGVSTEHAGQLLVTAGQNPTRLHSEASFAALCGACPIPASSGKTNRHRLNRGGDRAANRTLHMIAVVRMRWYPTTRAYVERRTAQGMSKKDIIRCLKRYIARAAHTAIQHDLANLAKPTPPGA